MPRSPLVEGPGYREHLERQRNERLEPARKKKWLQPFEAAHVLGVTRSAITQAIAKKHLPAQRYGAHSWLISRADLDWYNAHRQRGKASPWYGRP